MTLVGHLDELKLNSGRGVKSRASNSGSGRGGRDGRKGGDTDSAIPPSHDQNDTALPLRPRRRGIQRSTRSDSPNTVPNPSTTVASSPSPCPSAMDTDGEDGEDGRHTNYSPASGRHDSMSSSSSGGGRNTRIVADAAGEAFEFADGDENLDEQVLMEQEHWSRGQLDIWHKIRGRGAYPIFPPNWMLDFSNLPDELFVDPGTEPIIGAVNKKMEVRAILAFDNLMQLGGRVRDKWESGRPVERWLAKELGKYVQWAKKDGDIPSTYMDVFVIAASPNYEVCERRMSRRMAELAERHRAALETSRQFYASRLQRRPDNISNQPPPLPPAGEPPAANLYGFAVVGCIIALVTLNTGRVEARTRTLHVMDYRDPGMDVWNAIAVGLMATQARDEQVERVEWGRKISSSATGLPQEEVKDGEEDL